MPARSVVLLKSVFSLAPCLLQRRNLGTACEWQSLLLACTKEVMFPTLPAGCQMLPETVRAWIPGHSSLCMSILGPRLAHASWPFCCRRWELGPDSLKPAGGLCPMEMGRLPAGLGPVGCAQPFCHGPCSRPYMVGHFWVPLRVRCFNSLHLRKGSKRQKSVVCVCVCVCGCACVHAYTC